MTVTVAGTVAGAGLVAGLSALVAGGAAVPCSRDGHTVVPAGVPVHRWLPEGGGVLPARRAAVTELPHPA
ncbi:MAG TPA: hypothetical protein VGD67_04530, partial [Pseudonocardiaceae bacterium]